MPTGTPLNIDSVKVVKLYQSGLSTRAIAEHLLTNHTSIRKILIDSGIKLRDRSSSQKGQPHNYAIKPLVAKMCAFCGTEFFVKPGRLKRRTYCSRSCNGKANAKNQYKKPRPKLICERCGKTYVPKELHEARTRRFCSQPCALAQIQENKLKYGPRSYAKLANGCWEWQGTILSVGYGQISTSPGKNLAHRYFWEKAHGPIPKKYVIHHICQNKKCVNTDHLVLLTSRAHTQLHQKLRKH